MDGVGGQVESLTDVGGGIALRDKFGDASFAVGEAVRLGDQGCEFGWMGFVQQAILKVKEQCGYEDFMFHAWFESGGFQGEEVEAQMQQFAEEVTPGLARACGGLVKNPEIGVDFVQGHLIHHPEPWELPQRG